MRLVAMDRDLGHDCEPHLATMFCAAFGYSTDTARTGGAAGGLAAQDFFVRSASLALFGALCTRIFGADRLAGSRSSQLKVSSSLPDSGAADAVASSATSGGLTASEFFSRFPLLRQVIHQQLERTENMVGSSAAASLSVDPRALMATLVLLGRIAPSPVDTLSQLAPELSREDGALGACRAALDVALSPEQRVATFAESGYNPLPWVLRAAVGGLSERVRRLGARAVKSLLEPPLTASGMVLAVLSTFPLDAEAHANPLTVWIDAVKSNNGGHGLLYIATDLVSQMCVIFALRS